MMCLHMRFFNELNGNTVSNQISGDKTLIYVMLSSTITHTLTRESSIRESGGIMYKIYNVYRECAERNVCFKNPSLSTPLNTSTPKKALFCTQFAEQNCTPYISFFLFLHLLFCSPFFPDFFLFLLNILLFSPIYSVCF